MSKKNLTTGMVLGKFLPPHTGHVYLVEFARHYVDELTVVVGTLQAESIPGDLRYQWMKTIFPEVNVVHLTDENPQEPSHNPNFWQIWHDSLVRVLPNPIDYVFASEDYGWKLAEILGADFIPVDIGRQILPISGSLIREEPYTYWEYLPPCVRPYFLKRVCIYGPESTGKTGLAQQLAAHFNTVMVPEYARTLLELTNQPCTPLDIERIARGQAASEDALAMNANQVLICDTDVLSTSIWSDVLFDDCPDWILEMADNRHYDLYLLCDVDVPWVADPVRYLPRGRHDFFRRCQQALEQRKRPYQMIRGTWDERFQSAVTAIIGLF